jgi:hypothetical protein
MNTFLPYNDFKKCARILDNKRLNKQILEGTQIINIILKKVGIICDEEKKNWWNHPVFNLWMDKKSKKFYLCQLIKYLDAFYDEHICRGGKHEYYENKRKDFITLSIVHEELFASSKKVLKWSSNLHKCMKANLIRKDEIYYSKYFKNIKPQKGYDWENPV